MADEKTQAKVGGVSSLADILEAPVTRIPVLVLHANAWAFTSKDTGEDLEGVTVHYCQATKEASGRDDIKGWKPQKCTAPSAAMKQLETVPGYYMAGFQLTEKGAKLSDFVPLAKLEAR